MGVSASGKEAILYFMTLQYVSLSNEIKCRFLATLLPFFSFHQFLSLNARIFSFPLSLARILEFRKNSSVIETIF
jgi:hypothetical protein